MRTITKKIGLVIILCSIIGAVTPAMAQYSGDEKDDSTVIAAPTDSVAPAVVSDDEDYTVSSYSSSRADFKTVIADSIQPVAIRSLVSDTVQLMKKKDGDFWYADKSPEEKKKAEDNSSLEDNSFWDKFFRALGSDTAKVIVWSLIILVVLGIVVFFLRNNEIGLFASTRKKATKKTSMEELSDNIFEIDFATAINNASQEGNYKLAIRLLFLQLLKTMSEQRIIEYAPDKTNFDYLFQLSGSKYNSPFMNAVRTYEYVWYGDFQVNAPQYAAIQKGFNDFQQQLKP